MNGLRETGESAFGRLWREHRIACHRAIALMGLALLVFLFLVLRMYWVNPFPPCGWKTVTGGMDCPGCGLTRAMEALLMGDVVSAFIWHPWAIAWGLLLCLCFAQYLINALFARRVVGVFRFHTAYFWAALWSLVGFTVLRNIPFLAGLIG